MPIACQTFRRTELDSGFSEYLKMLLVCGDTVSRITFGMTVSKIL